MGAELFYMDRRTDGRTYVHDEANSRFSLFCERACNSAHTEYLSVLYISQSKQQLFPCSELNDKFIKPRQRLIYIFIIKPINVHTAKNSVYFAVRTESLNIIRVILLGLIFIMDAVIIYCEVGT